MPPLRTPDDDDLNQGSRDGCCKIPLRPGFQGWRGMQSRACCRGHDTARAWVRQGWRGMQFTGVWLVRPRRHPRPVQRTVNSTPAGGQLSQPRRCVRRGPRVSEARVLIRRVRSKMKRLQNRTRHNSELTTSPTQNSTCVHHTPPRSPPPRHAPYGMHRCVSTLSF